MKFSFEDGVWACQFRVPQWLAQLLRWKPDWRTLAHGKSSRSYGRHGLLEITIEERIDGNNTKKF